MIKMKLGLKTSALVSVGASTAANCVGCLEKTVSMAKETGADEEEIGEAVEIGRRARAGAASKLDEFATTLNSTVSNLPPVKSQGCILHRLIRLTPEKKPEQHGFNARAATCMILPTISTSNRFRKVIWR